MQSTASPRANRGPAAAAENRRALIAAAREVYADGGLAAPFSAVAKRAGVGQGSLYRHFPDRTALAVAVFEENVAELEEYISDPDRTIDDLLDRVVAQAVEATALLELITADLKDPRVQPLGERFAVVVSSLVEREHRAGRIGDHIDAARRRDADHVNAGHVNAGPRGVGKRVDRVDTNGRRHRFEGQPAPGLRIAQFTTSRSRARNLSTFVAASANRGTSNRTAGFSIPSGASNSK